jgi:pSer/pThr/pTyr-binding forkhead associated (FHA) protein/outer membrane biosynthesis protein TonB
MTDQPMPLRVTVHFDGKRLREVTFDRSIINVGKQSSSNLRLEDINVSRKHAVIERRESGEWRITDLGSTNGTTVNGRRITQAILQDGDRVLIGESTLVVGISREGGAEEDEERAHRPVPEIPGLGENSFYAVAEEDSDSEGMVMEVALLWGETVLTVQHFDKPEVVRVGEVPGCRFTIPEEALGSTDVTLLSEHDGSFALHVDHDAFEGDVLMDGSIIPLGDLENAGKLIGDLLVFEEHTRARLRIGEFVLLVSYGPMPARPRISPLGAVDYTPHIYVAVSAIVHIAFLLFLSLMPEDQLRSRLDPAARRAKLLKVLKVVEPEPEEDKEEEERNREAEKKKLEVKKEIVKKDDGLLNKLNKKKKKVELEALDAMSEDDRKKKLREMAALAGAAKLLNEDTGLLAALLDDSDQMMLDGRRLAQLTSVSGPDADPLSAGGAIDPFGGTLGANDSGGFSGQRSLGRARADGSAAPIAGMGKRKGKGLGDVHMKERKIIPVAIASSATVSGRLDRKTVQKIIRRNLSGIKWCYQDALQRNPKLRGKVTLSFSILPNGSVKNPRASNPSLNDNALLSCITRKMKRWKFPAPKDGGVVKVSYPLILKTR